MSGSLRSVEALATAASVRRSRVKSFSSTGSPVRCRTPLTLFPMAARAVAYGARPRLTQPQAPHRHRHRQRTRPPRLHQRTPRRGSARAERFGPELGGRVGGASGTAELRQRLRRHTDAVQWRHRRAIGSSGWCDQQERHLLRVPVRTGSSARASRLFRCSRTSRSITTSAQR